VTEAAAQRVQAVRLLRGVVVERHTTDQLMGDAPPSPLTQELVLGSLRHFFSLEQAIEASLHRPLKPRDHDLKLLMIVGAYQLKFMRVPDHAAIFETVEACAALGKPWARGLVNAVLRRCAAGRATDPPSQEHPSWLEQMLRRDYPDAEAIMTANNERAPMTLRINLAQITPADYLAQLAAAGLSAHAPDAAQACQGTEDVITLGPETQVLDQPCRVETLPGYREGLVSVQDGGAQFAAALLAPQPGERILDACAAPGGKLFQLLERCPAAHVTALERNRGRLARLHEEAGRLGHDRFINVSADAAALDWWEGQPYQRILLDAPCSGTGTLRRHPDIKVLRRPTDLDPLVALQQRLLSNLWRVLEPGGTLLYCTCSILAAENDEVIAHFLGHQQDAVASPFKLATGRATRHGWQLLPTDPDTDGFYYARMIKARTIKASG
jgi:16S rRNA (cytosine967-C5)-methyltransferase